MIAPPRAVGLVLDRWIEVDVSAQRVERIAARDSRSELRVATMHRARIAVLLLDELKHQVDENL